MRPVSPRLLCAAALFATALSACNKETPKPDDSKKVEATPVPSGMVFNDFLPQTGSAAGLGVRDAGLEGGLASVASGGGDPGAAPGDPAAEPGRGPEAALKVKVVEPGAEPRALRKYAFAANRVDKRALTMAQSVSQSMQGQTAPGQEVTLKMLLDLTPKQIKPNGATIEVKVTKLELPGAPPQATQMLAAVNGLAGTFDVTSRGEVGEISFSATPQMKNQIAETVVQGLSQAAQLLLAPFPDAPIGVGAKWELSSSGQEQGTKRFTLKELNTDGAVVDVEIEIKVPRHAQQGPRGGTMFVEVNGKGKYNYLLRFDRMPTKVEGELALAEKIEVPDPKSGQKQSVVQTQRAKHVIEVAK